MNRLRPAINPRPQYREVIPAPVLIAHVLLWIFFLAALRSALPTAPRPTAADVACPPQAMQRSGTCPESKP